MKPSCILVDDETAATASLIEYIRKTDLLDLKGHFCNGNSVSAFLIDHPIDVIFINIDRLGMSGLELAAKLPTEQQFVFLAGSDKYVLETFQYRVIDYLIKPVAFERLFIAAKKICSEIQVKNTESKTAHTQIFVKNGSKRISININDLQYIRGEKEYVGLHFNNERVLVYKRMNEMESLLPSNFIRVHRSYIINKDYITKMLFANLIMIGNERIPISRSYASELKSHISTYEF